MADAKFVPVIEPVREALKGLDRSLAAVCDAGGHAIVIVNPYHGDHREDGVGISSLLKNKFLGSNAVASGILLKKDMTLHEAVACYETHKEHELSFIHAGFAEAKKFSDEIGNDMKHTRNIFFESHCGKLYRKHFAGSNRVLLVIAHLGNA